MDAEIRMKELETEEARLDAETRNYQAKTPTPAADTDAGAHGQSRPEARAHRNPTVPTPRTPTTPATNRAG